MDGCVCPPEINCTATTVGNALFAQTAAASPAVDVTGTCVSGYYVIDGAPYTSCNITGAWQTVQNPCIRTLAQRPPLATVAVIVQALTCR